MSVTKKSLSSQSTIQSLLAENGQLIETIAGFQRIGKYDDVPRYMELLYKNILYLAKLGDPELASQLQQESGLNVNIENQMKLQHIINSQTNVHTQQQNQVTLQQQQQPLPHSQQQHSRLPTQHHFIAGTLQQPLHQNGTLAASNSIGSSAQYSAQPGLSALPPQHIPGSISQPLPPPQQYPSTQIQYQSISDALHHHQPSQNSGPALYSSMYSGTIPPQQPPPV